MPDFDFNIADAPPAESFDRIPAGWYKVTVETSEKKSCGPNAKDPNGSYFSIGLEVVDGEYAGRKLWTNLNLWNANEKTVSIAKSQLSALTIACGKAAIKRTEELHGIPIMAKVTVRPARDGFEESNEVKGFKPTEVAQQSRAKAQGPAASGAAPWQK